MTLIEQILASHPLRDGGERPDLREVIAESAAARGL
jgi:hypothetical protein